MLREAKGQCDHLIVGLQTDPTIDRADKNKPIQSLQERYEQIEAIKYVDEIHIYETEEDLYTLMQRISPDLRFIGTDWKGKKFTGHDLPIKVRYTGRYGYSTSELRERVCKAQSVIPEQREFVADKNAHRHYVPKGWGYEDWLVNKDQYCGKLLFIKKGKRFSWHYHKIKDETFYIHKGSVELTYGFSDNIHSGTEKIILEAGDTFHIPVGLRHQVRALLDSEVFEFSTTHFDEDSHRIIKGD